MWALVKMLTGTAGNIGKIRRVASFSAANDRLTFLGAGFPSPIAIGDTYDLHLPAVVISQATFTKTDAGSWTVNECGLFTSGTIGAGDMGCRILTGAQTVNQSYSLLCKLYSLFMGEVTGDLSLT